MPYEYTPPKYAQLIRELQHQIDRGNYPPGSPLPSEHQLSESFQVARATVARALQVLRQDGWIVTQQGRGSFVRGRPPWLSQKSRKTAGAGLDRDESAEQGNPIEVELRLPPQRIAELLGRSGNESVLARRRVLLYGTEASELVTWWIPQDLVEHTGLKDPRPLTGGVLRHLMQHKGIRVHHVIEQISARHPTAREIRTLAVDESAAMLAMYLAARDADDAPLLVLQVVMPGNKQELEDIYPLTWSDS
jgi:GntR family transcriptional regulator